jgi:DNA-binding MarR family transcriptional regulator
VSIISEISKSNIDEIVEDLIHILPVFQKRLIRMDLGRVMGDLTRLHFTIMGMLSHGSMSVTECASSLMMTKSQITHLVDQLVGQDIMGRQHDERDRRVINLSLTEQSLVLLEDAMQKVQVNIKHWFV